LRPERSGVPSPVTETQLGGSLAGKLSRESSSTGSSIFFATGFAFLAEDIGFFAAVFAFDFFDGVFFFGAAFRTDFLAAAFGFFVRERRALAALDFFMAQSST
jgi:hypothetical protein